MRRWGIAAGALALAAAAAAAAPPAPVPEIAAARRALQAGDGIAAEAIVKRALERGLKRDAVAAEMGAAWLAQGDTKRAREWLGPAQFAPGSQGYGWRMIARLERADGDIPAAGRAFERALALAPNDPELWVDIARFRYAGGEHVQAVAAAERAVRVGPRNLNALQLRGQLVRDAFGPAAALPWFEAALKIAPKDLAILGDCAATLAQLDRGAETVEMTRRMIEIAPHNAYAWYLRGALAARAGDVGLARIMLNHIDSDYRRFPALRLLDASLELEAGNHAVAREAFEQLADDQPGNLVVRDLLARTLYESGQFAELTARFGPAAARADATPYLTLLVGRGWEAQGRRDLAAPLLDSAARVGPATFRALAAVDAGPAQQVRATLDRGELAAADALAQRYRVSVPGNAGFEEIAGDTAFALGRWRDAADRYQVAAAVRMDGALLVRRLAAMAGAGQGALRAGLFEQWFAGNPSDPAALRLAGAMAAQVGDWPRASEYLASAASSAGQRDARLLAELAVARLNAGETETALAAAQEAYALQPASPLAAQALGMVLARDKATARSARSLLRKARATGGDNPMLAKALAVLG